MPVIPPKKFISFSAVRPREQTQSLQFTDKSSKPLSVQFKNAASTRNISIPQNSRFEKYLNVLDDYGANINTRIMATQEVAQLLLSLNTIDDLTPWLKTLQNALRYESAIPDPAADQTKGRDALFELYVAGRMKSIGIQITQGEPDIICNKQGFLFSIADKRIKSKNKLLSRVKEARNQIERAGLPGIVALDLSPLQDGYHGGLKDIKMHEFQGKSLYFLDINFECLLPKIQEICKRKNVFGIIAFAMFGGQVENSHTIFISQMHSGRRLCLQGSTKSNHFWEIVDLLSHTPLGII